VIDASRCCASPLSSSLAIVPPISVARARTAASKPATSSVIAVTAPVIISFSPGTGSLTWPWAPPCASFSTIPAGAILAGLAGAPTSSDSTEVRLIAGASSNDDWAAGVRGDLYV